MGFNKFKNISEPKLSVITEVIFMIALLMTLFSLYNNHIHTSYERNTFIVLCVFISILVFLNYTKITCCLTVVSMLTFFYLLTRQKEGFNPNGVVNQIEHVGKEILDTSEDMVDDIGEDIEEYKVNSFVDDISNRDGTYEENWEVEFLS